MITLKLPVIVDAHLLRRAFEAAHRCGTEVRIETFFRIVDEPHGSVESDSVTDVMAYARVFKMDTPPTEEQP